MAKKPFKSLNEEILLVQLEDYVSKFESGMSKQLKKDKKAFIKALIPFIIGIILSIITLNPLFIAAGTFCLGISGLIKNIKDDKEHDEEFNRYLSSIANRGKVISLNNDEPLDIFLATHNIVEKNTTDFYTPEFKKFIEEEKDSIEVEEPEQGKIHLLEEEHILCKDEVMQQIVHEYDVYCTIYNIPPMTISRKEWDALFDVIYDSLKEKGIENELYNYMSFLQRYTFAYALLHKTQSITIYSFLNQMHMLEKVGFTKLNIDSIISKVNSKINVKDNKVINLSKLYPKNK